MSPGFQPATLGVVFTYLIINISKMESVWKVTTQSMSLSLFEVITAPMTFTGMFERKLR